MADIIDLPKFLCSVHTGPIREESKDADFQLQVAMLSLTEATRACHSGGHPNAAKHLEMARAALYKARAVVNDWRHQFQLTIGGGDNCGICSKSMEDGNHFSPAELAR